MNKQETLEVIDNTIEFLDRWLEEYKPRKEVKEDETRKT